MKYVVALAIFLLAAGWSSARAQSNADDQYLILYSLIQQADTLAGSGQPKAALNQYIEVQGELQKFQKIYPDWNPKIVSFRLKYLARKIDEVTSQLPVAAAPEENSAVTNATADGNAAVATAALTAQLATLRGQYQALQTDNTALAAKLKEALAAQPAIIDSRELAKAQEQIRSLMKENDLLKASAGREPGGTVAVGAATGALLAAQAALAAANQQLSEQTARADKLAKENQTLQARVESLTVAPGAMEALREENAMLKQQLAGLQAATNSSMLLPADAALKQARLQIATLQSDVDVKHLENLALERRLQQMQAGTNSAPVPVIPIQAENLTLIAALTKERNDLMTKLGAANEKAYGSKNQAAAAQVDELTDQVNILRARLAVDEAEVVPYTAEELALFQQAAPKPLNPDAGKKSIQEMPAGSAALVAEAQRHFSAREYDQAEDNYEQILQRDENNSLVLGNLAAIELQQGKLDEAEKHLQAAIARNPEDAFNLSTFGYLKYREGKYDDALDALSRAAKLDPHNPEIQNYLGVTLSHKGLRVPAETALRRALELDPHYAAAHNNLAVIYINQQPPLVQLARWHYQKALEAGQPPNPDLEKILDETGTPVNPR